MFIKKEKKKQPADLASIVMNYATHAAVKNGFSHSTKINDYMKLKKNKKHLEISISK